MFFRQIVYIKTQFVIYDVNCICLILWRRNPLAANRMMTCTSLVYSRALLSFWALVVYCNGKRWSTSVDQRRFLDADSFWYDIGDLFVRRDVVFWGLLCTPRCRPHNMDAFYMVRHKSSFLNPTFNLGLLYVYICI